MKHYYCKLAIIAFVIGGGLLTTGVSHAVERAMLEKSASFALNNSVHAFRVPTVDNLGALKYYDVKIDLLLNPNGTIQTTANVASSPSPNVGTVNIVPGVYQESNGTDKCTVINMRLPNGRLVSTVKCTDGNVVADNFEFVVASGPISTGHPFLTQLVADKVNLRTDAANYNWGMRSAAVFSVGVCTHNFKDPIGAYTNGNQLVLTVVATTNAATVCTTTLTKLP